jgi:hypothetical protein
MSLIAFEKIKKVIGTEVLLCYPDFDKPILFDLYTDASDSQLGSVIMQDKKPETLPLLLVQGNTEDKRIRIFMYLHIESQTVTV